VTEPIVRFERNGHVGTITINRPEARNAVNGDVAAGIEAAIDELEADSEMWCGVVFGSGPVFSAGADLKAIAAGEASQLATSRGGFAGIVRRERQKPLIAAVDGPALAGGLEIVLSCDLVVASTSARFGLPEVKRSLVAGAGGLFRLGRQLPRNIALELLLTGEPISAQRAYDLGFVNLLCQPGLALESARELALSIAANAPRAVQASLRLARAASSDNEGALFAESQKAMVEIMATEDFAEGPRAFIEKRAPKWQGR
jgi:enoyl-CoA hydratase